MVDFNYKIKDSNKFRQAAIYFQKHGYYCPYPPGTTEYIKYWDEETDRSLNGYTAPDGDWCSGYNYFYLNYCPILRLIREEIIDRHGNKKMITRRDREFADFYDYDWYYYNAIQDAEDTGQHMAVLKARGKGYSFKGGSMLCRNYYLIPGSRSYAIASETEFLTKDGLLTKAGEFMDFIDEHTAWAKKRTIDRTLHKRAGYMITDEFGNKKEDGYKSEIIGVTLKNDPQKARGKRGKLILWEEAGKFKDILQAWQIARPSVEEDGQAYGTMIAFGTGGCLTAGNKVWTGSGKLINIEDLKQEDGIIGFDVETGKYSIEPISWMQPPTNKECVKVTTNTGRTIECSWDHPIYKAVQTKGIRGNVVGFKYEAAADLVVGNKIAILDKYDYFGSKQLWEPRLIGWLIGDGSYRIDSTPTLSNCEPEINNYVLSNFNCRISVDRLTKLGKEYKEINIKGICKRLKEIGIYGQTKLDKTLPKDIHSYDKYSICELLGGLFDTDGYVNIRMCGKKTLTELSISSISESLLNEIRLLLNRIGVHGRLRKRLPRTSNQKDKNPWYEFTIADIQSIRNFYGNVKLFPKTKQDRLQQIAECNLKQVKQYKGFRLEEVISVEDVGIKPIYNLTAATTNTYIANGIITHNTVGDDFAGLRELCYNPSGYNVIGFPNIWDENVANTNCAFFCPTWANMSTQDDKGKRLYMDSNGNSYHEKALEFVFSQRQKVIDGAADSRAVDRYIAEHPINLQEACLELTGNIFPKKELQLQLANIRTNKKLQNHKQVGDLIWNDGQLVWQPKKNGDIIKYPLGKDDDPTGSIVIWEHPMVDPPHGLYIAGCDPYDHDQSGTNSLGSTFIYKRFQDFESYYDVIVAEYTGRPSTAEEYYENVRKLLFYYNAKLLYENERKGIFPYFTQKHCDYLLADQPDIISDIIGDSKVNRKKGIHMTKQIKAYGEGLIKEWLNEEYAPGKKNLTKVLSEPLLEELIQYNDKGNFDRVIGLIMVMIYREQLYNNHVKQAEDNTRKQRVFDIPLFGGSNQDYSIKDDTPIFTF